MTIPNNDEHREALKQATRDRADKDIASQPPEFRDQLIFVEKRLREIEDVGIAFCFNMLLGSPSEATPKGYARETFSSLCKDWGKLLFNSVLGAMDRILGRDVYVATHLLYSKTGEIVERYYSNPESKNMPPAAPETPPALESTDSPHGPL